MADEYPEPVLALVALLKRLPGIGARTAERLTLALLDWDEATLRDLGERLTTLKASIHPCRQCGNLAVDELCGLCQNPRRDRQVVCVVEQARQIPVIEKCGRFHGLYHVLGGRLAPLDGVEAEDLRIESLFRRLAEQPVREVILATSPDVEGEATASYLAAELRQRGPWRLSRIALGVPVGADLSFADAATMAMALDSRRQV